MVEYIRILDQDVLGSQRKLTLPSKKVVQRDPPQYGNESTRECMHREIGSPYTVDVYDLYAVESALLIRGW